jgi:hypothetical protein
VVIAKTSASPSIVTATGSARAGSNSSSTPLAAMTAAATPTRMAATIRNGVLDQRDEGGSADAGQQDEAEGHGGPHDRRRVGGDPEVERAEDHLEAGELELPPWDQE